MNGFWCGTRDGALLSHSWGGAEALYGPLGVVFETHEGCRIQEILNFPVADRYVHFSLLLGCASVDVISFPLSPLFLDFCRCCFGCFLLQFASFCSFLPADHDTLDDYGTALTHGIPPGIPY